MLLLLGILKRRVYLCDSQKNWIPSRNRKSDDDDMINIPSGHLLVQSQQKKRENNVWNLFKVNNKDTVNFEQILHMILLFLLLTLSKQMPTRFSDLATFDILSVLEFRGYFFVKLAVYHCFYYALLLSNLTHVKKTTFLFMLGKRLL